MKTKRLLSTQKDRSATERGFSLVEILLASSILVIVVTGFTAALIYGQESTVLSGARARAVALAEEGLEEVRNIRDPAFANLPDGTYGLTTAGNQWNLSGSSDVTDIFTRQVVVSSVDTKRKSIATNVTWQQNPQRTGLVSLVTRLTNWIASGIGNWASPLQAGQINFSGTNDATKIQVLGNYVYILRNGGAFDFGVIDVSNPASPALVGSLVLNGTAQNLYVLGSYAYVASDDNNEELQIINIATPSAPALLGTYDAPGGANAFGVYASGTTAYLTRASSANNEFLIINAAVPAAPALLGSLNLGASGNEIIVSGTTAYIASSDNSQELKVVNISNPLSPSQVGSLNLAGTADAITIALAGSTVFIGQGSTLSTINAAVPASPVLLSSLGVSGTLNDIALNLGNANTYVFIATSDTANEFKVIDVTAPASPTLLGQRNITGSNPLLGIAYDVSLDRAFVAGQSNTEEFAVIAPQ